MDGLAAQIRSLQQQINESELDIVQVSSSDVSAHGCLTSTVTMALRPANLAKAFPTVQRIRHARPAEQCLDDTLIQHKTPHAKLAQAWCIH